MVEMPQVSDQFSPKIASHLADGQDRGVACPALVEVTIPAAGYVA